MDRASKNRDRSGNRRPSVSGTKSHKQSPRPRKREGRGSRSRESASVRISGVAFVSWKERAHGNRTRIMEKTDETLNLKTTMEITAEKRITRKTRTERRDRLRVFRVIRSSAVIPIEADAERFSMPRQIITISPSPIANTRSPLPTRIGCVPVKLPNAGRTAHRRPNQKQGTRSPAPNFSRIAMAG